MSNRDNGEVPGPICHDGGITQYINQRKCCRGHMKENELHMQTQPKKAGFSSFVLMLFLVWWERKKELGRRDSLRATSTPSHKRDEQRGLNDFQILKIISKKDEGGGVFPSGKIIIQLLVSLKQECQS